MNQYTIYCTEAQTKKALGLGAPIEQVFYSVQFDETIKEYHLIKIECKLYEIPTAEQMIGWLEEQEDIDRISIDKPTGTTGTWDYEVFIIGEFHRYCCGGFKTRKEATLAAIDAALEYLTNKK